MFVRNGITCKIISNFELSFSESRWLYFTIYRPPDAGKLSIYFEELSQTLSKTILKYQNINIMGDFNIDLKVRFQQTSRISRLV